MPNLWLVRPCDANETAVAWKVALERRGGPVALALTRQKLPTLDRSEVAPAAGLERGAYVALGERRRPDVILIATGSEVALALEAGRKLAAENGTAVRVVSMPCWELFEAQPQSYRDEVLPPEVKARLSVEAGVTLGWERWVGDRGRQRRRRSLRRLGAGGHDLRAARLHRRRTSSRAPRRSWSEWHDQEGEGR